MYSTEWYSGTPTKSESMDEGLPLGKLLFDRSLIDALLTLDMDLEADTRFVGASRDHAKNPEAISFTALRKNRSADAPIFVLSTTLKTMSWPKETHGGACGHLQGLRR